MNEDFVPLHEFDEMSHARKTMVYQDLVDRHMCLREGRCEHCRGAGNVDLGRQTCPDCEGTGEA